MAFQGVFANESHKIRPPLAIQTGFANGKHKKNDMVTELLQKYIWMVQMFIRVGERGISLTEIEDRWENRFGTEYPRRTFNNHREAIEEVFGIRIECNRSTNRYFVRGSEDVSDENAESAWLINTFTVNNMLSLGKERLSGRVAVEDIPSGHRHLTSVMEAMTENKEITIEYQKYTSEEPATYILQPYAVKEFAKRWYIIGNCIAKNGKILDSGESGKTGAPAKAFSFRVYGLDRVKSLELTDRTFRMPANFDVDELFATSFGIYIPEGPGQTIIFRTTRTEARFLRDLPLHPTQQELPPETNPECRTESIHNCGIPGTDSVTFSIFACPNKALIMEFCKHASRIEVLSPASVRDAVREELAKALEQYNPCRSVHET